MYYEMFLVIIRLNELEQLRGYGRQCLDEHASITGNERASLFPTTFKSPFRLHIAFYPLSLMVTAGT